MTLDDLEGRLFAGVPEVAEILGVDERTVRRAIQAGEIPSTKIGAQHKIRTSWLREQAGQISPAYPMPVFEPDQIAEAVAARLPALLARAFAVLASDVRAASGPRDPEVA